MMTEKIPRVDIPNLKHLLVAFFKNKLAGKNGQTAIGPRALALRKDRISPSPSPKAGNALPT